MGSATNVNYADYNLYVPPFYVGSRIREWCAPPAKLPKNLVLPFAGLCVVKCRFHY